MSNQERQLDFEFETPRILSDEQRTELIDVTSDDNSPFLLSLTLHSAAWGDVWIRLQDSRFRTDSDDAIYLPQIRFRSAFGGGLNTFIAEELAQLPDSFYNHIKIDEGAQFRKEFGIKAEKDRINSNSVLDITRNNDKDGFKIKGLQDDDEMHDELSKFIDLEVTNDGDVILTQRDIRYELDGNTYFPVENSGQMLFKSKENGGKYPSINETLKGLANRIKNAKDPRINA